MAEKRGVRFYNSLLKQQLSAAVLRVALYIIRQLSRRQPVNFQVITTILADAFLKISETARLLANVEAASFVVLSERNLSPLRAFTDQRNQILQRSLTSFAKYNQQFAGGFSRVTFGRRGQDLIREIGLRNIERGIISGSIGKSRNALTKELLARVPVIDGKFRLEIAPYEGTFRTFDVKGYADLVARTTRREAQNFANTLKAEELGTRLVKWNLIGKDYRSMKDPCAVIDGNTYSIEEAGTLIAGKYFPFWRTAIKGGFATPHPNCNHFLRPVSEARVASLTPGGTFSEFAGDLGLRVVA